jgi:L-rhamnose mutarotase
VLVQRTQRLHGAGRAARRPDGVAALPVHLSRCSLSIGQADQAVGRIAGRNAVRYCFQLQVRPERLAEYTERHRAVWPEMLAALRDTGWRNYSLFLRDDGLLIGYVEADDLAPAQAAMAATAVNARWQAEMAPFFVGLAGRGPDEGFLLLREIFHLEDQLDAIQ